MTTLDEIFGKITEKTGKKTEELKKELDEVFEDFKKKAEGKKISEEQLKEMSINKLTSSYRKQLISSGETFEGIFIGIGGRFDMAKKKRAAIFDYHKENPEDAIKQKMIEMGKDKDGNDKLFPLYWEPEEKVAKMQKWQKDNLGKRIPETDFKRTLYGVLKIEEKLIETEVVLRGKNSTVIPKLFNVCKFVGYKKRTSTEKVFYLNDSGQFNPSYSEELDEDAVSGIFETVYKDRHIELSQSDDFITKHDGEFNPLAIVKVNIIEISTNKTSTNSFIVNVADDTIELDKTFTCWIPDYIDINFPEASQVYVIGKPSKKRNKADDGDNYSIGVVGVFVPEIFRNAIPQDREDIEKKSDVVGKW